MSKQNAPSKLSVSVVIPSYNRAHLLRETIPSYIQESVTEVILVDDCSSDHTGEVIRELQVRYPQIRYFRNERNLRQTGAKNRGVREAVQPYIYFGDDDSVLLPGTIPYLLEKMQELEADVVSAIPIYSDCDADMEDLPRLICRKAPLIQDVKEYVDIAHLERTRFFFRMAQPLRVPFTNACVLMKREWVDKAAFDTEYGGNAYREETDYFLQLSEQGAKIYFAASEHAAQINLPFARIGRTRTFSSMWRHGKYDLINTMRLIEKHHWFFRKELGYPHGKTSMKIRYVLNDLRQYFCIFPGRIWSILRRSIGS